jgi:two-component system response regulator NreC
MTINILIADDHTIFRAGLTALLKKIPRIGAIKEAANGKEVIAILNESDIDIVLMDITMPVLDGIETTLFITREFNNIKVIALSMHEDQENIIQMLSAGAVGYLLKNTDINELKKAIYSVMREEKYYSQEVSEAILSKAINKNYSIKSSNVSKHFTEKEKQLLHYISKGLSATVIAQLMGVAEKTVEGYKTKLFQKSGAKNVASLVLFAVKHNIVKTNL